MPSVNHDPEVLEDPVDGTAAFAYCGCGWLGRVWEDYPDDGESSIPDDERPPPALDGAYRDRYGHIYRTGQLGLSE